MGSSNENLLSRVAETLSMPPSYAEPGSKASILTLAAASYGSKPQTEESDSTDRFRP